MTTITRLIQRRVKASGKIMLALVLMSPFFALGGTGSETPIENIASIAGEWGGSGKDRAGNSFSITYYFQEDGSFTCKVDLGFKKKTCDGTLRLNNGKLEWENERSIPYIVTLFTGEEGKRSLTGVRADGVTWTVKAK